MRIVLGKPADARLILAFDRHVSSKFVHGVLSEKRCMVAKEGKLLLGLMVWNRWFFGRAYLDHLMTAPAYRRQGIGSALMAKFLDKFPRQKVFTSTNRSNKPMQKLLARFKFRRCGEIRQLDPGDSEWIYVKPHS